MAKDSAMQAISQENKTMWLDKMIAVRTAVKKGTEGGSQHPFSNQNAPAQTQAPAKMNSGPSAPQIGPLKIKSVSFNHTVQSNHIEIMAMSREFTEYAENIESYLKERNLKVDLLYPNPTYPMPDLLDSIKSRGTLFALEVDYQNVKDETVTVYMLYSDAIKWNKNMAVKEALEMVQKNTKTYLKTHLTGVEPFNQRSKPFQTSAVTPLSLDSPSAINSITDISQSLKNLIRAQNLTVAEMDGFIESCRKMRQALAVLENTNAPEPEPEPEVDPAELALQQKLQKISNAENYLDKLLKPEPFEMTKERLALLQDPKIERALDTLLHPDIFSTLDLKFIQNY